MSLAWLAHALSVKGDRDRVFDILCQLDDMAQDRYVSFYHRALIHAGLGDLDATFSLLARACEQRDPWLMHLASEPRFDVIRPDARYAAVLGQLGLNLETSAHA